MVIGGEANFAWPTMLLLVQLHVGDVSLHKVLQDLRSGRSANADLLERMLRNRSIRCCRCSGTISELIANELLEHLHRSLTDEGRLELEQHEVRAAPNVAAGALQEEGGAHAVLAVDGEPRLQVCAM